MTDRALKLADVERLATTLDSVNLDETDRATLHAIFALAGHAAGDDTTDEVAGFLLPAIMPIGGGGVPDFEYGGSSLIGSFQWGVRKAGGEVQPIDY